MAIAAFPAEDPASPLLARLQRMPTVEQQVVAEKPKTLAGVMCPRCYIAAPTNRGIKKSLCQFMLQPEANLRTVNPPDHQTNAP
jgi:hypothetical protein